MSHADHEWAMSMLEAYVAGGLEPEERAQVAAHADACAECRAELDALTKLDRSMGELFVPVRAKPDLEDRVIRALRTPPLRSTAWGRVVAGIAAVLLLGLLGFVLMEFSCPTMECSVAGVANRSAFLSGLMDEASPSEVEFAPPGLMDEASPSEVEFAPPARLGGKKVEGSEKVKGDSMHFVSDKPFSSGGHHSVWYNLSAGGNGEKRPDAPQYFEPGSGEGPRGGEEEESLPVKEPPEDTPERPPLREREEVKQDREAARVQRKIICSGHMEFEIESFDAAIDTITAVVAEEKGFVATVNSERLPNGKMMGSVVVRVPPENLERLLLKLRALGDLKSRRIGTQDVTKHYTDLSSRLRAAKTMEARLLKIIDEGKGEVKDLLQAEKLLGEKLVEIEKLEGEIKYYNNLVAMSTLTLTLYEKEIRSPFAIKETEVVQMGLEVEDVEASHRQAIEAVEEAKGRISKSELRQHAAGQYNAILHGEVAPEKAGELRDRLKQLGTVARLEINRLQKSEGGTGRPGNVEVQRADTQFQVSLYNLANVQPRETVQLALACRDVEGAYKALLVRVGESGGRILTKSLNRQKGDQTRGTIRFEVKTAEAEAVLSDARAQGEVMKLEVVENPDSQNVTKTKRGFNCDLMAMGLVSPRETTSIKLAAKDVPAAYRALTGAAKAAGARVLAAQLDEQDRRNVTASFDFEVSRENETAMTGMMEETGDVYSRTSSRAQNVQHVVDSKVRYRLTLLNVENIPPRETFTLGVEVGDVDGAVAEVQKIASEVKGRTVASRLSRDKNGIVIAEIVLSVPLDDAAEVRRRVGGLGAELQARSEQNPQVPDSELATAQINLKLSNDIMVPSDAGPMANIKKGLSFSLQAGSWALMLVMVGLCFILPIALVCWGGMKLYRRLRSRFAA